MTLLYIWLGASDSAELIGVRKKIRWQLEAMEENGIDPWLTYNGEMAQYLIRNGRTVQSVPIPSQGLVGRTVGIARALAHIARQLRPDMIYVRLSPYELNSAWLLSHLKKSCSRMLLEIPTYPFDREEGLLLKDCLEQRSLKHLISLSLRILFERSHRFLLKRYFNKIVTYMPYDTIWGIPVLVLENGVNVRQIPLRKERTKDLQFDLVLISVAFTQFWDGYDRILLGMAKYKAEGNTGRILYRVVGDGPEISRLKTLSKELRLGNEVLFYGTCDGAKLDALFDGSDLAISTIAYHRVGLENSGSTLKVKEYCARGIPFVYASDERALNEGVDFALRIDSSDEPLDMGKLIRFSQEMRGDRGRGERERDFAARHYDWKQQMGRILADA